MEPTPKVIEIQGIVRNATKIGVQDGQAEDLINLRFMDGSWRASGNGRQIVNMPTGTIYEQIYVHTNVYHHLLGVDNGVLYWFAEIDNDGVTFYPLDGTTDRSQWPEDKQDLPTKRKALTTVVGDIWITQTGHLLTVIDENDDFEHFVFKTGEDAYVEVNVDVNGKATDRSLYPFGQVHFNLYEPEYDTNYQFMSELGDPSNVNISTAHSEMISVFNKATTENKFTAPFLVIAACRLYDGSHGYASQPVLLYPRELTRTGRDVRIAKHSLLLNESYQEDTKETLHNNESIPYGFVPEGHVVPFLSTDREDRSGVGQNVDNPIPDRFNKEYIPLVVDYNREGAEKHGLLEGDFLAVFPIPQRAKPVFSAGAFSEYNLDILLQHTPWRTLVKGSDIVFSLDNIDSIDGTVITGIDIFITKQADVYYSGVNDYTKSPLYIQYGDEYFDSSDLNRGRLVFHSTYDHAFCEFGAAYVPGVRTSDEIIYDLINSPFYLLKSYKKEELEQLKLRNNPIIVDLTKAADKGKLGGITASLDTLETEAFSRTTYIPKVAYQYNNRLHIANYKSYPFFGYPIDLFHLHNHSVKVQDNAWFPADQDGQRVLPNLTGNNEEFLQYPHAQVPIKTYQDMIDAGCPYIIVSVEIETAQGNTVVTRYIPADNTNTAEDGRADFIEDLNPLLTYPDARAKKMTIQYVVRYVPGGPLDYETDEDNKRWSGGVYVRKRTFTLKPHPYLNIAYYIDPDLKPIKLSSFVHDYNDSRAEASTSVTMADYKERTRMQNAEEYFPNGLKVSKTDQPMFFPVENTYQVGSAEILALMSNTIAVGTGQTGDAPLYVFCKDGVYALYVDSSGQMAYPNARILARDVCNNPRSVTPIDAGVVFTTDRGLMMIAGEQVQEIGAPAEGDVVQFWNAGSVDYSKIATASMQQIAGLPSNLCSTTDFLTYLQDKGLSGKAAIINYNHNMRELMVSNPNYSYSYVLDREGNWSRRDYTAAQYVNNYPTSYRVDADGHFYKVDDEGNANTTLEHRKEADNKIFYLSNVIKLDSIGFKQAYRFVVRGYFETINPFYWQEVGRQVITGSKPSSDKLILDADTYAALEVGDVVRIKANGIQEVSVTGKFANNLVQFSEALSAFTYSGLFIFIKRFQTEPAPAIACVVEGSYDGIKFAPLGFNRKSGKFTNIGCHVSHTDVRFFRVCISGQVTGKTRIDYMEMSAVSSKLNTKIR